MSKRTVLIGLLTACIGCQAAPPAILTIGGWSPQGEPAGYDPNGLWELIDGAADVFLSYGFESLTVQHFTADNVTVAIAVYDMGTPLNAFGIYHTEAPEDGLIVADGSEATVSPPYQCLLLKDRYYVKIEAYDGDIDQATGESLVAAVAAALPGEAGLPPEFAALPSAGMVPGSAKYTRQAFLGLTELNECVHAAYGGDADTQYQGFAILSDDAAAADATWQQLAAKWNDEDLDGSTVLYRQVPYAGFVGVIRTDREILGIADASDEKMLLARLRLLAASAG